MKTLLLLVALLASTSALSFDLGKVIGDKSLNIGKTSKTEEIRIGREIAGNLLGAAPLVKDDALQQYVNRVGLWLALQSERPELPWHFGVIQSDDINAFSAPGGYVLITLGLYKKLNSEAELAGVLGHEIGHIIKKHHLKLLQKQQMLDVGADILGKTQNDDTVKNLIGSGAEICARSLDKDAEFEADRIGAVISARAGYDSRGLPSVLETLGHITKSDSSMALLFKTHPAPEDRLAKLGQSMATLPSGAKEGKILAERLYHPAQ